MAASTGGPTSPADAGSALTWGIALALAGVLGERGGPLGWGASLLLVQSWFVGDPTVYFGGNGPSWSLSCEVFFYALFPLLAPALLRRPPAAVQRVMLGVGLVVAVGTLVLEATFRHSGVLTAVLYVLPLFRLWEFVLGIGLARLVRSGRVRVDLRAACLVTVIALAVLAVIDGLLRNSVLVIAPLNVHALPSPIASLVLVPCFLAVIAAAARHDLAGGSGLLRSPALVRLGRWSFALYLSHLFVPELVAEAVPRAWTAWPWIAAIAGTALAIALAGLLYTLVETPLERRLRPRGRVRVD